MQSIGSGLDTRGQTSTGGGGNNGEALLGSALGLGKLKQSDVI